MPTTKRAPMVYAEPERVVDEQELAAPFADTGLNGAFVADLFAMVAHERCGVHLYRSAEGRANDPELKGEVSRVRRPNPRTRRDSRSAHRRPRWQPGVRESNGKHAVEAMDSNLLESTFLGRGSLDPMTAELSILSTIFLAETIDHANWETLKAMSDDLPVGATKDRVLRHDGRCRRTGRRAPRVGQGDEGTTRDAASDRKAGMNTEAAAHGHCS